MASPGTLRFSRQAVLNSRYKQMMMTYPVCARRFLLIVCVIFGVVALIFPYVGEKVVVHHRTSDGFMQKETRRASLVFALGQSALAALILFCSFHHVNKAVYLAELQQFEAVFMMGNVIVNFLAQFTSMYSLFGDHMTWQWILAYAFVYATSFPIVCLTLSLDSFFHLRLRTKAIMAAAFSLISFSRGLLARFEHRGDFASEGTCCFKITCDLFLNAFVSSSINMSVVWLRLALAYGYFGLPFANFRPDFIVARPKATGVQTLCTWECDAIVLHSELSRGRVVEL